MLLISLIVIFGILAWLIYNHQFKQHKNTETSEQIDSTLPEIHIKVAVEPVLPVLEDNMAAGSEEKDNWENFDFYNAEIRPATGRYLINYEDQRGLKTERRIEVKRV